MTYAIKAEGIGKVYRLGERTGARLLSETISSRRSGASAQSEFHALSDVSFEIEHGTAVGIIGRNGAGKTTLLKLISRITRPTTGELRLRGRVGSLLEVGTGFHPELTGRENIFMNGSMLGMRRAEIARKFDEIVAFADVDRFIDTPVKRYSSGMYVRLAFAVAAHLEPEILVVDEVLAVGDANFQRKCLGRMGEVARDGRTVLFVSHNIASVQQLTTSAILLEQGRLAASGPTAEIVDRYMSLQLGSVEGDLRTARRWDESLRREVELLKAIALSKSGIFQASETIQFQVTVTSNDYVGPFRLSFTVYSQDGAAIGSAFCEHLDAPNDGDLMTLDVTTEIQLAPGRYYLWIATGIGDYRSGERSFDVVSDVCHFEVATLQGSDGTLAQWSHSWGRLRLEASARPSSPSEHVDGRPPIGQS